MTLEGVEPIRPDPAVWLEPVVQFHQRLESHPVHASLGVRPHRDQTGTTQYPKMLRYPWLGDSQRSDDVTDRSFLFTEELEDASSVAIGQYLERVHLS
jgi:hypothetical protein